MKAVSKHISIASTALGKQALFSLLAGILILLTGYLWEIPMFYGADNTFVYSLGFFYLGSILEFALGGFLVWFAAKEFDWKPNKILVFALLLVAIVNAVASLSLGGEITPSYASHAYSFPLSFRFVVAVSGFDTMFGVFFLFGVLPSALKNKKILFVFMEIICGIALATIIHSYITEADTYRIIINEGFLTGARVQAFTGNSNRMGFDIMAACFAEIFILHVYKQRWRYITLAYFFVSLLFTGSKTAIVIATVATLGFLIYRGYWNLKNRKRDWAIAAYFAGGFLSIMTILFFAGVFHPDTFLGSLSVVMREGLKVSTVEEVATGRGKIWLECWGLISANPFRAIFGYGRANYSLLIREIFSLDFVKNIQTGQSHNAFVEILGEFGFIGLLVYLGLGALLVRRYIKEIKGGSPLAAVCLLLFGTSLLRQLFECPGYFDMRYESIMMGLICITPVMAPIENEMDDFGLGETVSAQGKTLIWILFVFSPCFVVIAQYAKSLAVLLIIFAFVMPIIPFLFSNLDLSKTDGALVLLFTILALVLIKVLPFDINNGAHVLYFSMPSVISFFYFLLRPYISLKGRIRGQQTSNP